LGTAASMLATPSATLPILVHIARYLPNVESINMIYYVGQPREAELAKLPVVNNRVRDIVRREFMGVKDLQIKDEFGVTYSPLAPL
jgi:hypothetical protein